jgi:S1-C subfamily serine protease
VKLQAVKQTGGVNRVDAALARPLSPDLVNNEILDIGAPTGTDAATLGTEVQKTGRTTGHTQGIITQIDATLQIDYQGRTALFTGQLVAGPMSQPGDSGSAVLDVDGRVIGLLFAGSDAATIINPIDEVLAALGVELAV